MMRSAPRAEKNRARWNASERASAVLRQIRSALQHRTDWRDITRPIAAASYRRAFSEWSHENDLRGIPFKRPMLRPVAT